MNWLSWKCLEWKEWCFFFVVGILAHVDWLMVNFSFVLIHELVELEMFGVNCNLIDQLVYFQPIMIISMSSVLDMFCDSYVFNNQSKLLALHCQLG
jgi:hypothetical protein